MIITPTQAQQLTDDRQFAKYAAANQSVDYNPLFKGNYFATVGNFDIFKSPQLTKNSGGATPVTYAQAFGPGMIGLGAGNLPHTAYNTQDNYGETALVVWLWYAAFGVLDNRFGCSLRTS